MEIVDSLARRTSKLCRVVDCTACPPNRAHRCRYMIEVCLSSFLRVSSFLRLVMQFTTSYCGDEDSDHHKSDCPKIKIVYLIRHCESTGNIARGTSYDPLLTNQGLQQAINLAKFMRNKGIRIDKLISSPLRRCIQTAHIAFRGFQCPFELDPIWREIGWREDSKIDCVGSSNVATFVEAAISCEPPRLDVESIRENLDCGVHNLWEPCKEVQPGYMNETYQRLLTSRIQKDAFVSIFRRPERVFAVVSHYGTIESLIRRRASNGMMFCVHLKLSNNENSGHDGWEVLSVEEMRRG